MVEGAILIGSRAISREPVFRGINPATGEELAQDFPEATTDDVAAACAVAEAAAQAFGAMEPEKRATFLEQVADEILAIGDALVETVMAETGLPRPRLEGERMRTANQLRMFADELRDGHWLDATIDPPLPSRVPPRPDLRRMNVPLGPVAVFGASNFPLAFSVAGGDTAAAFAAGCPVVVKGHPAHPETGELVARAIQRAAARCGMPEGVFSYLPGRSNALGTALVADSRIKAVGFTGSRAGGLALMAIAAARSEPIPVYAEMSSINPVVLMPAALAARAEELGEAFVSSLLQGAGQFCTNPGLVIAIAGADLDRFAASASAALAVSAPSTMLTPAIYAAYELGVKSLEERAERIAKSGPALGPNRCSGAIFAVSAEQLVVDPALAEEVFGATSVIVRCKDLNEMATAIAGLEGQLTATLQFDAADETAVSQLLPLLQVKAGRVLANGWPTGVEVTPAMVHGGPFPATSDGRSTSVGTLAMARFLRPVCYQDIPDRLLPSGLREANPWQLPRRIDGKWQA